MSQNEINKNKLTEEATEIILKYKEGKVENVEKDLWDDPTFELYNSTDQFGFIKNAEIEKIENSQRKKLIDKELARTQKWLKMLKEPDKLPKHIKLQSRIYKGIPEKLRGKVWECLLNVNELKKNNPQMYKTMLEKASVSSSDIRQIDLDVNRTYRHHLMFRLRYDIKQRQLFNVLCAYSLYNPEVGYCQGMSEIVALLLMYMDEEEAFWGLSQLMIDKKYSMHGFFVHGLPKLKRFQEHFDRIMKLKLKKIRNHLVKMKMYTDLFTVKWFLQCFIDRLPFHLVLRLWDIYIYMGEKLLIGMSFNIMYMHQRKIITLNEDNCMIFFQTELAKDFGAPDDLVIESLEKRMDELYYSNLLKPPLPGDNIELPKLIPGASASIGDIPANISIDSISNAGSEINFNVNESTATSLTSNHEVGSQAAIDQQLIDRDMPTPYVNVSKNLEADVLNSVISDNDDKDDDKTLYINDFTKKSNISNKIYKELQISHGNKSESNNDNHHLNNQNSTRLNNNNNNLVVRSIINENDTRNTNLNHFKKTQNDHHLSMINTQYATPADVRESESTYHLPYSPSIKSTDSYNLDKDIHVNNKYSITRVNDPMIKKNMNNDHLRFNEPYYDDSKNGNNFILDKNFDSIYNEKNNCRDYQNFDNLNRPIIQDMTKNNLNLYGNLNLSGELTSSSNISYSNGVSIISLKDDEQFESFDMRPITKNKQVPIISSDNISTNSSMFSYPIDYNTKNEINNHNFSNNYSNISQITYNKVKIKDSGNYSKKQTSTYSGNKASQQIIKNEGAITSVMLGGEEANDLWSNGPGRYYSPVFKPDKLNQPYTNVQYTPINISSRLDSSKSGYIQTAANRNAQSKPFNSFDYNLITTGSNDRLYKNNVTNNNITTKANARSTIIVQNGKPVGSRIVFSPVSYR